MADGTAPGDIGAKHDDHEDDAGLPAANVYAGVVPGLLGVIAVIAALYLARAFFVPLLIGILASYTLRPVVDWLHARYVPRPVGAALTLLAVVGTLSWVGYALSDDTAAMIERLPETARKLRRTMSDSRED